MSADDFDLDNEDSEFSRALQEINEYITDSTDLEELNQEDLQ